jgi:hypothetical protein
MFYASRQIKTVETAPSLVTGLIIDLLYELHKETRCLSLLAVNAEQQNSVSIMKQ